jgi:biopolymer transport protein ExbB/TolQ
MEQLLFNPLLGMSAIQFAFEKATPEGKVTICFLALVSMLSWTVILTKGRQLWRARRVAKKFFAAYRSTRDPLDLHRKKQAFDGAPAFELYCTGAEEMTYHLTNSPVQVNGKPHISRAAFDFVRVAMERAVSTEGMGLEKA